MSMSMVVDVVDLRCSGKLNAKKFRNHSEDQFESSSSNLELARLDGVDLDTEPEELIPADRKNIGCAKFGP